jgi:hypothetical protein
MSSSPLVIAFVLAAGLVAPATGSLQRTIRVVSSRGPAPTARDTLPRTDTTAAAAPDSEDDRSSANLQAFRARQRAGGMGYFVDELRLRAMHPALASEALRTVPGIVLRPTRRLVNEVRIHGCAPLVWIDGQRATGAELDDLVHGSDVAAMEVYASMVGVPPQFADRSATCGTVLVWTRPA